MEKVVAVFDERKAGEDFRDEMYDITRLVR
jgi:hypothetical protein